MDDLRRFCDSAEGNAIDVYSNEYGLERIRAMFPYALGERPAERGYPCFRLRPMPEELDMGGGLKIRSVSLPHGPVETLGLVFECGGKRVAYYTDCKSLPPRAEELAAGADVLAIDCLRLKPHPSHMTLSEALEAVYRLAPKRAFLTHTTSHIDFGKIERTLPENCHIAYDGLTVEA